MAKETKKLNRQLLCDFTPCLKLRLCCGRVLSQRYLQLHALLQHEWNAHFCSAVPARKVTTHEVIVALYDANDKVGGRHAFRSLRCVKLAELQ